jgi:choline-sulfatase
MDFLPTLADLARPGRSATLARPVDGSSLVPLLEGEDESPDATVVGEYLAEIACGPMVMIRRDRWKYISAEGDPEQLFDLEDDPLELVNLADDAQQAAVLEGFREERDRRWDLRALDRDVRESQQARLTVFPALQQGAPFPWDFQPIRPSASQYTRNTADVTERDQLSRFPPADS